MRGGKRCNTDNRKCVNMIDKSPVVVCFTHSVLCKAFIANRVEHGEPSRARRRDAAPAGRAVQCRTSRAEWTGRTLRTIRESYAERQWGRGRCGPGHPTRVGASQSAGTPTGTRGGVVWDGVASEGCGRGERAVTDGIHDFFRDLGTGGAGSAQWKSE